MEPTGSSSTRTTKKAFTTRSTSETEALTMYMEIQICMEELDPSLSELPSKERAANSRAGLTQGTSQTKALNTCPRWVNEPVGNTSIEPTCIDLLLGKPNKSSREGGTRDSSRKCILKIFLNSSPRNNNSNSSNSNFPVSLILINKPNSNRTSEGRELDQRLSLGQEMEESSESFGPIPKKEKTIKCQELISTNLQDSNLLTGSPRACRMICQTWKIQEAAGDNSNEELDKYQWAISFSFDREVGLICSSRTCLASWWWEEGIH